MKIALAQINSHLGNFEHNSQKVLDRAAQAYAQDQPDMVVFPELSLLGYAPYDLLERPELIKKQNQALKALCKKLKPHWAILCGGLYKEQHKKQNLLFNAAFFIYKNKVQRIFKKELLPNYDVFYEKRFFSPGSLEKNILNLKGKTFLVSICEDIWASQLKEIYTFDPINKINRKIDAVINLSASPFYLNKHKTREKTARAVVKKLNCSLFYVNQVGAQDELIFDGGSFALDAQGKKIAQASYFKEDLILSKSFQKTIPATEQLFQSLVLGIQDYFKKNGFKKAHLGLSGGIDSGVVLALAAEALGPENVTGIALPSPYNKKLSLTLAKKLSKNLGSSFYTHEIKNSYELLNTEIQNSFGKRPFGLTQENLQARLRGLVLMAFSNAKDSLLLATSNKSELTVGYSTLYGDQCGALMPIGDLLKTQVFELAKWYNHYKGKDIIPKKIISRPPSAELRPNQKDSDSLPDYTLLDAAITKVITNKKTPTSDLEKWVLKKSYQSEFKRWQACPILKVSPHAFGRGRMMPLSHNLQQRKLI